MGWYWAAIWEQQQHGLTQNLFEQNDDDLAARHTLNWTGKLELFSGRSSSNNGYVCIEILYDCIQLTCWIQITYICLLRMLLCCIYSEKHGLCIIAYICVCYYTYAKRHNIRQRGAQLISWLHTCRTTHTFMPTKWSSYKGNFSVIL